jgi:hypothetical protein
MEQLADAANKAKVIRLAAIHGPLYRSTTVHREDEGPGDE